LVAVANIRIREYILVGLSTTTVASIGTREPHEYIFANTNIHARGQIDTRSRTSINYIILVNIPQILEYSIFARIRAQTSMNTQYSQISIEYLSFDHLQGSQIYYICYIKE